MRLRVENQNDFNRDKEIKSSAEIIKVSQASEMIGNGREGHWTESNRNEVQQQQKRQKRSSRIVLKIWFRGKAFQVCISKIQGMNFQR